jgi:ribonuclease T1
VFLSRLLPTERTQALRGPSLGRTVLTAAAALPLALSLALAPAPSAQARTPQSPEAVAPVALAALPRQARETHELILQGGPFPYRKDGTTFFNRERLLPERPRGHYREYTVRTPGSPDRGARRIVCGGEPPTRPEVCYYTADHYASFSRIVP